MMWITLCGYVDNYVKLFILLCFGVWINVTEMLQVITELLQYCYVFVIIRILWNCYELLQICCKCYKIVTDLFLKWYDWKVKKSNFSSCQFYYTAVLFVGLVKTVIIWVYNDVLHIVKLQKYQKYNLHREKCFNTVLLEHF